MDASAICTFHISHLILPAVARILLLPMHKSCMPGSWGDSFLYDWLLASRISRIRFSYTENTISMSNGEEMAIPIRRRWDLLFKGWTLWGGTGAKSSSRSRSANHVIHLSQAQHPIHQEQWGQEGAENNILYFERPRMEYKAINTKS